MTRLRAHEADLVPMEPAAMDERQIIEWDKEDIDALNFMKVDVLGLGMPFRVQKQQRWHLSPPRLMRLLFHMIPRTTSRTAKSW